MVLGTNKIKSQVNKELLSQPKLKDLKTMVERIGKMYPSNDAIIEKHKGGLLKHRVKDLLEDINALGTALIDMGLAGKNIAILGENSYYWIVSFLAVSCGVGVAVPLDKELADAEIFNLLKNSDAGAVFYSKTFDKLMKDHELGGDNLKVYISLKKDETGENLSIEGLIKKGKSLIAGGDKRFISKKIRPQSLATIIFTSGTTGANKGVMLSHENLASNIEGVAKNPLLKASTFSVLPINHIYELNCNILPELYANTLIYINDSLRNLMTNFSLFKPEMAVLVPAFMEAFYEAIWQEAEKTGKKEKLQKAIRLSKILLSFGIDIRKKLFRQVHDKFGGNLKAIVCGGAAINPKYVRGLSDFGYDIYLGYGLTEASPLAALNTEGSWEPESVGPAFNNTQIKIHKPNKDGIGEIWLKGENVSKGYYKDDKSTSLSFNSGWFKTGDYGKLSHDGHLSITGRKKNLIILDNGKNVHPEEIENLIKEEISYVKEVVVLSAEKSIKSRVQKIITAVISVNLDDFPNTSLSKIYARASQDISKLNKRLAEYKMVRDVKIVTAEFEKTSTNKIIRQKVAEDMDKITAENLSIN